LAEIIINMRCK